tara:strand:+ start:689 stop:1744 length:1056 start_codon:yes stop_codon:yes gene_type:complete
MQYKFYVKDCPEHLAVHDWIAGQSNIYHYVDVMEPKATKSKVLSFTHPNINLNKVQSSVESAFNKYGYYGFLNIYGSEVMRDPYYGGLSLVYNPNYKYKNTIPRICHTLGYPRTNMHMGFILENIEVYKRILVAELDKRIWEKSSQEGTHAVFDYLLENNIISQTERNEFVAKYPNEKSVEEYQRKNTYTDSWSFNQLTDVMYHEHLADITKLFKRNIVRSRLAKMQNIDNKKTMHYVNNFMWHRDDTIFIEARINLSVTAPQQAFGLEVDGHGKYYFNPGEWLSWDTGITHRPFADKPNLERCNLVYAVSPWFDYIKDEDAWVSNEFYGEKHPMDMFVDGDIVEGLEVKS